jgi:hypothetical protein
MAQSADWLVTQADLLPPVRQLLGSEQADIVSWEIQPIAYAHISDTMANLRRVMGTAILNEKRIPWSLVLKILRPLPDAFVQYVTELFTLSAAEVGLVTEGWLWDREASAYASLLADLPGNLRAPRCFGVVEPAQDVRWLWLEDVANIKSYPWSLDDFSQAARALGTFNGAYLADRPLPAASWLNHRWVRIWSTLTTRVAVQVLQRSDTWQQPAIRRAFPAARADRLLQLADDVPHLLDQLDTLPPTLCHHDAFCLNLLRCRTTSQETAFVAIDWAYVGIGRIGEDVGHLLAASLLWNEADIRHVPALEDAIFEGYLAGLRDVGWRGDPLLARQGFALSAVARWGLHAPRLYETPGSVYDFVAPRNDVSSVDEIIAQRAAVSSYLLNLADRTRIEPGPP